MWRSTWSPTAAVTFFECNTGASHQPKKEANPGSWRPSHEHSAAAKRIADTAESSFMSVNARSIGMGHLLLGELALPHGMNSCRFQGLFMPVHSVTEWYGNLGQGH